MTTTKTTIWRDLRVTDSEGQAVDTLGSLVDSAPANLDNATISGGKITAWPGFFLSAEGEAPDWDTPCGEVDWTGFAETLAEQSGAPAPGHGQCKEEDMMQWIHYRDASGEWDGEQVYIHPLVPGGVGWWEWARTLSEARAAVRSAYETACR